MPLRIALCQMNATVGDLAGNVRHMTEMTADAARAGADLAVFPEMCVCGYPPEDLLHKRQFLADCRRAIESFATTIGGQPLTVLAGFPEATDGRVFNTLGILREGSLFQTYRKGCLPNYGVFDEKRYFEVGTVPLVLEIKDLRVALTLCEDIWDLIWLSAFLKNSGPVHLLVNSSASPFHAGKIACRRELIARCATHFASFVAYCNLVGGQDELVFDGRSMICDPTGAIVCQAESFKEDLLVVELGCEGGRNDLQICSGHVAPADPDPVQEVLDALILGTRDYVHKNGFEKVLIGLSGGIDSSLTAALAVLALGPDHVVGITMPSRFNAAETISDAEKTARNLGIAFHTIPIADVLDRFDATLGAVDGWTDEGIAYENLQARIRGTILMSLSNQLGYLVLTTGNKSETAVGYSTLYGDTAGGFAVIKDVPKTLVYELSRYINRNAGRELIPETVITRIPSAELRPDQRDSDSLPDYELLDRVLRGYVEEDKSGPDLIAEGLDADTVQRVVGMVDRNEYKRRQCPPGIKITPKAFGKDRRMPITNQYGR